MMVLVKKLVKWLKVPVKYGITPSTGHTIADQIVVIKFATDPKTIR